MLWISIICFIIIAVDGSLSKKGLPDCISAYYYELGKVFSILMALMAFCLLYVMLDVTPEDRQFLAFLACGGILFVGVAPNYKEDVESSVHKTAAVISGVCSVLWTAFVSPAHCFFLCMVAIALIDRKRWLLWFEVPCFLMVFASLLTFVYK